MLGRCLTLGRLPGPYSARLLCPWVSGKKTSELPPSSSASLQPRLSPSLTSPALAADSLPLSHSGRESFAQSPRARRCRVREGIWHLALSPAAHGRGSEWTERLGFPSRGPLFCDTCCLELSQDSWHYPPASSGALAHPPPDLKVSLTPPPPTISPSRALTLCSHRLTECDDYLLQTHLPAWKPVPWRPDTWRLPLHALVSRDQ